MDGATQSRKRKWGRDADVAIYGNYKNYYEDRVEGTCDARLSHLEVHEGAFKGKKCLDIGCNSGNLTIEIAKRYQPSFILGIDIDGDLISLAREQAKVKVGGETGSSTPTTLCVFKKEDFMEGDDHDGMESYDTICAFSITKWIHIHHGDEGIKRFFSKIHKLLSPGGTFILEPQLWRSYSKSAFRTVGDSGTVLKAIALKPAFFSDYLTTTGGFSLVETKTVTEGGIKNFKRPIYVFQKDEEV